MQAVKLADMIKYQEASVVSKEILKDSSGTISLFAFDRGQGLSEHTAPFNVMVYIMDGEADIFISGKQFSVKTGEMLIMPAGEPHSIKAGQRVKMLLVMIKK